MKRPRLALGHAQGIRFENHRKLPASQTEMALGFSLFALKSHGILGEVQPRERFLSVADGK